MYINKIMKNYFLILGILLCSFGVAAQEAGPESSRRASKKDNGKAFGLILKGSTNGVGADLVYQVSKKMDIRLGYDTFKYTLTQEYSSSDIDLDINADIEAGTISLLFDYYLGKKIFLTGGIMANNFSTFAKGESRDDYLWGDIVISREDFGSIDILVEPRTKIAPYVGLGFGRLLSQSRRLSMAFEMGLLYFGEPNLTLNATGALSPTSDPNNNQEFILENEIKQFVFYPVIKFNLGFKLSKNN